MNKKIFVNLPVKNLDQSMDFFNKLGFSFNQQFSNENGACMVVSEDIFVMLLTHSFYKNFTKKEIADATKTSACIICLSSESREAVDEMVSKAIEAGGTAPNAKQDHGFMYGHGFEDLDGHTWEVTWMDPSAIAQQQTEQIAEEVIA